MVPVLTIPEVAYDPSSYSSRAVSAKRSSLVSYLLKLTHGSAIGLTLAYIIGLFVLKPLLETTASRRLEVMEKLRTSLRDCFLNLVGRVSQIPIVAINKHNGDGKLYADAVVQTADSYLDRTRFKSFEEKEEEIERTDKLRQGRLSSKLNKLSEVLHKCDAYSISEIPHYRTTNYALKEFQNKADLVYFNSNELFNEEKPAVNKNESSPTENGVVPKTRKKNVAVETKNEIRHIKGLFMSGQI